MTIEENKERVREIKSNLSVTTEYFKNLAASAESAYEVWLSLNEQTADETEITAKKIEMLSQKLKFHKEIAEYTKQAYLEIKEITGEFSKDTIEAQNLYMKSGNAYQNLLAERNNIVNSATEKELKRVTDINKKIDEENKKNLGYDAQTAIEGSFAKVGEIVTAFNKFIDDHKENFLKAGGTYEELVELAKKQTGYDKVEEAFWDGRPGDAGLLKPYETVRNMGDLIESDMEIPEFDKTVIMNAYDNNFKSLLDVVVEDMEEFAEESIIPVFYDTGYQGAMKMFEGMSDYFKDNNINLLNITAGLEGFLESNFVLPTNPSVVNNYSNEYNTNYNVTEEGSSAYRALVAWDRFKNLTKLRGDNND